jgi:fibronectin type 3 domain-containing protein
MSKLACRVPTAPVLDATVVNHPDGNVELTWTASNPRGSAVINYYIERTITPSEAFSWVSVGSVAGTETKFNDTSIPSYGTVYYYRVYANNVAGDSDRSNERSCRPYRTPSAPTLVSVAAGTGSNTITWIASEHTYNTTSITYTLWWGIDSSNINNSIVLLEGQSPYEHAGIFSYEYFYYIEAKNHLGWSTNSSTLSAQPYGPPTHVQNLAIVVGNFTANLTWNAPEFNGGSAVSGYRIYRQRESDAEILLESNIETTYYNDVVSEYGEYTYRIVALNSYGEGNSNSISGKPNTTPMAIPQIIITSGFKCIILNWDEPADGGYEITQYLIYRGNPEGSHELIQSQTGRFFNHTNLVPGTKYNYYVIAQNILGDGKPSQVVVAYPDYVPSPPVNITKTTTLYSIVLGWGKAPQLDGVSIPNKYHIFRGTDAANLEQIAIVDAKNINSYNDSTAVAGTKYYYKISSLNQYGLGSQSEVIAGYRLVKITLNSESTKEGPVLTWEAVPNAAYYSVYRAGYQSIDIEELSPIANSITELTYTDVDAIDQGVYFYVVVAYDADGEIMGISDSKNEMALADSMADKTIKAIMDNLLYIIIGVVAIVGIVIYRVYRKRKYMSF